MGILTSELIVHFVSSIYSFSCGFSEILLRLRGESLQSIEAEFVGDSRQTSFAVGLILILHVGSLHGRSLGQ